MQDSITKEIIALDKKLREKIELLELEKQHLDQTIEKETIKLKELFQLEMTKLVEETKKLNDSIYKTKKQQVKKEFEVRLETIQTKFDANKDAWVESIFNACINQEEDFN